MVITYEPELRPQLVNVKTKGEDCGPRACQTGLDWSTRGDVTPKIDVIRKRMGALTGATNTLNWQKLFRSYDTPAELDGKYQHITVVRLDGDDSKHEDTWQEFLDWMDKGWGAVIAVDYGLLVKLSPGRTGSDTFKDGHAIFMKGRRVTSAGRAQIRSWDSLLDGRRRGIPVGPVWIDEDSVRRAARQYAIQNGKPSGIYAVLIRPAMKVAEPDQPPPIDEPQQPDPRPTLADVLGDLMDLRNNGVPQAQAIIDELEDIIGPYTGPADPADEPTAGVKK